MMLLLSFVHMYSHEIAQAFDAILFAIGPKIIIHREPPLRGTRERVMISNAEELRTFL